LQRVYVFLEHDTSLTSRYYELPVLLAILEAVDLLRLPDYFTCFGKIDEYGQVSYPDCIKSLVSYENNHDIMKLLNIIASQTITAMNSSQSAALPALLEQTTIQRIVLPGIQILQKRHIDVARTPLILLKRIPPEFWQYLIPTISDGNYLNSNKSLWLKESFAPHSPAVRLSIVHKKEEMVAMTISSLLKQLREKQH
jgi:hypothetical protein